MSGLVIAGNDNGSGHAAFLQQLAAELDIAQACNFVGEVRGEEKRAMLRGADAFVLTSHSEGIAGRRH